MRRFLQVLIAGLVVLLPSTPSTQAQEKKRTETPIWSDRNDAFGDALPIGARARLGRALAPRAFTSSIAVSPDSKLLASTEYQKTRLWELATGKELRQFQGHAGVVFTALFLGDGKKLATIDCNSVCVWETDAGMLLRKLEHYPHGKDRGAFKTLACTPDGKMLACGGWDKIIRFWDADSLKEVRRIDAHGEWLWRVTFSPDGRLLLSVDDKYTFRLWDAATGKELRQLRNTPKESHHWHFTPDGKALAVVDWKYNLRVWDIAAGDELPRPRTMPAVVGVLAFSPDGQRFVSHSLDNWILATDLSTGKQVCRFQGDYHPASVLTVSPDGKTIVSVGGTQIFRVWDTATGRELQPFPGHLGEVLAVAVSADGRLLATRCNQTRMVRLWDAQSGRQMHGLQLRPAAYGGGAPTLAFSPDGRVLASAGPFHALQRWETATGKELADFPMERGETFSGVAFSPDGRLVVTEGSGGRIRLREAATGRVVRQLLWPSPRPMDADYDGPQVTGLVFSPGGRVLAGASGVDSTFHLWDVETGRLLRSPRLPGNGKGPPAGKAPPAEGWQGLAFSPDGRSLAGLRWGDRTSTLHLWELATGKERRRFGELPVKARAQALAFAGGVLATGGADGLIRFWDAATGAELGQLRGHQGAVTAVAFLPGGKGLASGSADTTVLIWDLPEQVKNRKLTSVAFARPVLESLWDDLAATNANTAYQSMITLAHAPKQTVKLLEAKVAPAKKPDTGEKSIAGRIADLGSSKYAIRARASEMLKKVGHTVDPDLRSALVKAPDIETKRRLEELLERITAHEWTQEEVVHSRAVELLEVIGTPEARALLTRWTSGDAAAVLTVEARQALARLQN